jgi:enterochelin esterase-like enzyme
MKPIFYLVFLQIFLMQTPAKAETLGMVTDYHFFSKALNREMTCRVYLPEGYDQNNPMKRYPVVYFLHGATSGYGSYDIIYPVVDNLIAFKVIKPIILVLPDGLVPPFKGSFYTNSELYGNFEDYIANDLISFIYSAFYTRNERGKRAIMGVSMGGYGALKMAFKHQELFIGVSGHSGPVNINLLDQLIPDLKAENGGVPPFHWEPDPDKGLTILTFSMAGAFSPNLRNSFQVDFPLDSMAVPIPDVMERWKINNICEIAKTYHPAANLGIHFDCGSLDDYYLNFQNRSLADTLKKYNIAHEYLEYLGNHVSGLPLRVTLSFKYFDQLFQTTDSYSTALPASSRWKVYPSPALNSLSILNDQSGFDLDKQVFQLRNSGGQCVYQTVLTEGTNRINTNDLPAGLYFYQIQCGKSIQVGKTIIVH